MMSAPVVLMPVFVVVHNCPPISLTIYRLHHSWRYIALSSCINANAYLLIYFYMQSLSFIKIPLLIIGFITLLMGFGSPSSFLVSIPCLVGAFSLDRYQKRLKLGTAAYKPNK